MRRGLLASAWLGLAACLEPGAAPYARRDETPPQVRSTEPAVGATLPADGVLRITFSELMDERTLRPGIAVFAGREEVALRLEVPALAPGEEDVEGGDVPYTVAARAEQGAFASGTAYTLVLRTSLTDFEGNALPGEVRVPFRTAP